MSDEVAALDFDFKCTERLAEYDDEREKRLLEAIAAGGVVNAVNQIIPQIAPRK